MKTLQLLWTFCFFLISFYVSAQNIEIYVSDAGNYNNPPWQILKFDEDGKNPEVFIENNLVWPQDILFLEDQGIVLISNLVSVNGYIAKHDMHTGDYLGNFAEEIDGPTRMKIGSDGLLYVLQWSSSDNKVLRYQLNGTFVDEFTSAGVPQSIGLDWDSEGKLYVSSYGGKYVQYFDTDGNDLGAFISANLSGPTNIWFVENGDLLVNDYLGASVKRFGPDGEYLGIYISGLFYPEGVAYLENGNILIGNGGTSAVKMFDPEGNFLEDLVESGAGDLITPNAIVIRDVPAVTIPEKHIKSSFIYPTYGRTFYLDPSFRDGLDSIEIYSLGGAMIEKMAVQDSFVWRAEPHVNGPYLVVARMIDGRQLTQKILVR
jgi:DNA-binding beta-propeller fold protein YncE